MAKQLTKTVAGHELTLTEGKSYLPSRPMGNLPSYTVTVWDVSQGWGQKTAAAVVTGLSYDEANELLQALQPEEGATYLTWK